MFCICVCGVAFLKKKSSICACFSSHDMLRLQMYKILVQKWYKGVYTKWTVWRRFNQFYKVSQDALITLKGGVMMGVFKRVMMGDMVLFCFCFCCFFDDESNVVIGVITAVSDAKSGGFSN